MRTYKVVIQGEVQYILECLEEKGTNTFYLKDRKGDQLLECMDDGNGVSLSGEFSELDLSYHELEARRVLLTFAGRFDTNDSEITINPLESSYVL